MTLLEYVLRRLLWMIPTLLGTMIVIFFLAQVIPGDAAIARVGQFGTVETINQVRKSMGLDLPLHERFVVYLTKLARGDLGHSYRTGNPVNVDLAQRLPASLELAFWSMVLAFPLGVLLGAVGAASKGKWLDRLVKAFGVFGVAVPVFWLGLIVVYVFYFVLGVLPAPAGRLGLLDDPPATVTGFYVIDSLVARDFELMLKAVRHLALPVLCLVIVVAAPISRMTYSAVSETLQANYTRAAIAAGLPRWRILFKYALKNAMIPIVTLAGQSATFLIAGAVLVEIVFSWPGIGRYAVESMVIADLAPVQAFVLLTTFVSLVINLLVDISYFYFDPRIKVS